MKQVKLADILELPVSERILLVEDIWDSIAVMPDSVVLTNDQRQEIDRRLEEYHNSPEKGSPWEEVKARIKKS